MDSFLEELRADGQFNSDGAFTVDLTKARLKLEEYQLARFEMYPRFLVSAAIQSGARALDVVGTKVQKGIAKFQTTLYFRGWSLSEEDVRALDPLAADDTDPALKSLAIALSTVGSRHPIILKSRAKGETLTVRFRYGDIAAVRGDEEFPEETTTLRIQIDLTHEIKRHFAEAAKWNQVRFSFNRRPFKSGLSAPLDVEASLGFAAINGGEEWVEDLEQLLKPTMLKIDGELPKLFLTFNCRDNIGLKFLVGGVAYDALPELRERGVQGFLVGDQLKPDLSYMGLVRNEAFKKSEEAIRRALAMLLEHMLSQGISPDEKEEMALRSLLRRLRGYVDFDDLQEKLNQSLMYIAPTLDPDRFQILKTRAADGALDGQPIVEKYAQMVEALRADGEIEEALQHQECHYQLLEAMKRPLRVDQQLKAALRLIKLEAPQERGDYLLNFLEAVHKWSTNAVLPWEGELPPDSHPSWRLPFICRNALENKSWEKLVELFAPSEAPRWLRLWQDLHESRVEEASAMLNLEQSRQAKLWYSLLWLSSRGRVPFRTAVKLRARYSFELLMGPEYISGFTKIQLALEPQGEFSGVDHQTERAEFIEHHFHGPEFWPRFLAFFLVGERPERWGSWSRRLWGGLIAQEVFQNLMEEPSTPPLARSFLASREALLEQ